LGEAKIIAMTQIERITRMEDILDKSEDVLRRLEQAIDTRPTSSNSNHLII
jgi:hypothetical protein